MSGPIYWDQVTIGGYTVSNQALGESRPFVYSPLALIPSRFMLFSRCHNRRFRTSRIQFRRNSRSGSPSQLRHHPTTSTNDFQLARWYCACYQTLRLINLSVLPIIPLHFGLVLSPRLLITLVFPRNRSTSERCSNRSFQDHVYEGAGRELGCLSLEE